MNERGLVAAMLSEMGISVIDPAPQLAAMIHNLDHFKTILRANPPAKRKKAYEELSPHLPFSVPAYEFLFESSKQRKKRLKQVA